MSTTTTTPFSAPADTQVIDLHSVIIEQGDSLSRLIQSSTVEIHGGTSHPISTERAEQDIKAAVPDLPGRARNLAAAAIADGWLVRIEVTPGQRPVYNLLLQWPPARIVAALDGLAQRIAADPERSVGSSVTSPQRVQIETRWAWDVDAQAVRWVSGEDYWSAASAVTRSIGLQARRDGDHRWFLAQLISVSHPSKLSTLKTTAIEQSPVAVDQSAIEAERRDRAIEAAEEAFDADRDAEGRGELRRKLENFLTSTVEKVERIEQQISDLNGRPVDWGNAYRVSRTQDQYESLSGELRTAQHLRDWITTTCTHEGQLGPDGISPQYIDQVVERRLTQLVDGILTGGDSSGVELLRSTYRSLVGRIVTGVQISVLP